MVVNLWAYFFNNFFNNFNMAEIKLTMEEYKSMENALSCKSKEVDRLEKEVKGLQDFSRVIVRDIIIPSSSEITDGIYRYYELCHDMSLAISRSFPTLKRSCQYVNFEDVKQEVYNKYQKEIEESVELSREAERHVSTRIAFLETEYGEKEKELQKEYDEIVEEKDKEIETLKSDLIEASKSMEDKKSEFEAKKAVIEKELADLVAKYQIKPKPEKKRWWQ